MPRGLKVAFELFCILVGCAVTAYGINGLIVPAHLLSGGLTGICVIINHFTGWEVGTQYLIFNIPLLFLGYRYISKKFSFYTVFAVIMLSLFLNIIKVESPWTHDPLLSAIFGGIISGVGDALVLRMGGSTGGLGIVGRVIATHKNVSIGRFNLILNSGIVAASAFMYEAQTAMYTIISFFTSSKAYDMLLNHVNRIAVYVVTDQGEKVAEQLLPTLGRGVTMLNAQGSYTKSDKQLLYCVIVNEQLPTFRTLVLQTDPNAFISVVPALNVFGQFKRSW